MKRTITLFVLMLLLLITGYAQKTKKNVPQGKGMLSGTVASEKYYIPLPGVQAFLYAADSTIAGSGYTDGSGKYESNNVMNGIYTVKFVYPSKKALVVTGVPIDAYKTTVLSIKQAPPAMDTTAAYTDLVPKPAVPEKKKGGHKK